MTATAAIETAVPARVQAGDGGGLGRGGKG